MPRPKGQGSLAKNQMQLAIALSSSLEESKKHELSELTEELPASTIENGLVPQNIKQMQKKFLEQLQMPQPGPSKKSKKPRKPVPTLLIRSSEERLRILTEKVALVLIKDDTDKHAAKVITSSKLIQDDEKQCVLWGLSSISPSKTDQGVFYIDCLTTFVTPTKKNIDLKLSTASLLPGKLKTPVKRTSKNYLILQSDISSQSPLGNETEFSAEEGPLFNQSEEDCIDQDYQAQLELQNDWQRMLHNTQLSDITIVVKEGTKILAHKLVLFARCPAMVEDLDSANILHWINVQHCQAIAFLEYIYGGIYTRIRALGEDVEGVLFLARKYNLTELLKFIIFSNSNAEVNNSNNCNMQTWSSCDKNASKSGIISPDLFVDHEQSTTIGSKKEYVGKASSPNIMTCKEQQVKTLIEPHVSIEISSDEEENKLLMDFFGTCNPTLSSPTVTVTSHDISSAVSTPLKMIDPTTCRTPPVTYDSETEMITLKKSIQAHTKPSQAQNLHLTTCDQGSLLQKTILSGTGNAQNKTRGNDSEEDLFSSSENNDCQYQNDYLSSPEEMGRQTSPFKERECSPLKKCSEDSKETPIYNLIDVTSDEEPTEVANEDGIKGVDTRRSFSSFDTAFHSSGISRKSRRSLYQTSKGQCSDGNKSNYTQMSSIDLKTKEVSPLPSSSFSKRMHPNSYECDENGSFSKKKCISNENILMTPNEQFYQTETCSVESKSSPYKLASTSSEKSIQNKTERSYHFNKPKRNLEQTFRPASISSPDKFYHLKKVDSISPLPKISETSTLSKCVPEQERNLLDDSFNFDINDSLLLRHSEGMQTPKSNATQITPLRLAQLRTPLDELKTSSPVTPMPDYNVMSDEEFEEELARFGLKKSLTRSKGIKMLTHIYQKLHPLVEVVSVDGRELHIPLGARTPTTSRRNVDLDPVNLPASQHMNDDDDLSEDEERLSRQNTGSSGDDTVMLEETFLDEDDGLTQGVPLTDLKTAVQTWITSQPAIHEMILCFEPIWLDSFHQELKSQFDKKVKLNQLMDILDEQGITFRAGKTQQSWKRNRKGTSPRKQTSPKKKLETPTKNS